MELSLKTTVCSDYGTRDVAGSVRSQENGYICQFLGLAHAAQRYLRFPPFEGSFIRPEWITETRPDHPLELCVNRQQQWDTWWRMARGRYSGVNHTHLSELLAEQRGRG